MAMRYEFWLPLVLALLSISQDSQSKKRPNQLQLLPGRIVIQPDFIRDCPNVSTSTKAHFVSSPNIRYSAKSTIVVNADIRITRLIPQITQAIIVFQNCEDRASGRCQLFQTWRLGKEVCQMWGMENQIWSPIFKSFTPRFSCPMQPGLYRLRNGTIDMRILAQRLPFPLEKYYWRTHYEVFDPTLVVCNEAGTQFLRSRS